MSVCVFVSQWSTLGTLFQVLSTLSFETRFLTGSWVSKIRLDWPGNPHVSASLIPSAVISNTGHLAFHAIARDKTKIKISRVASALLTKLLPQSCLV